MRNRAVSYIIRLATAWAALLLGGCNPGDEDAEGRITVWHWMADKHDTLVDRAREYESRPGVRVEFELYAPSDVYNQKVRAAAQAKRLPDVFGLLAEKHDLASFIKAGYVLEVSDYLAANGSGWKDSIYGSVLSHNQFADDNEYGIAPGYYGIPLDLMTVQMIYNKALFAAAGLDPELEYGVFLPPAVSRDHPMLVWGSAGASLLVNAQSGRRDEAVRFLKWLTDTPQQSTYAQSTASIPANRNCAGALPSILAEFAKGIESSTHPSRWPIMETAAVSGVGNPAGDRSGLPPGHIVAS